MRSRYSAYAIRNVEHIMRTTHPDGPHYQTNRGQWMSEIERFCDAYQFDGLEVVDSSSDQTRGWVRFWARISLDGVDHTFGERSLFYRVNGAWLYHSGTALEQPAP